MIHGAVDGHAVALQRRVRVAQVLETPYLERDVGYTEMRPSWGVGARGIGMREQIDRVEIVAEGHEHAPVLRIPLGDAKAEDVAVEGGRPVEIGHAQEHVADLGQADRGQARAASGPRRS